MNKDNTIFEQEFASALYGDCHPAYHPYVEVESNSVLIDGSVEFKDFIAAAKVLEKHLDEIKKGR